jgi:hypothetical protein
MTLTISGTSRPELLAKAEVIFSDDELLEALRRRMRRHGYVVTVDEFVPPEGVT